mgnify:CR=1 FL=1
MQTLELDSLDLVDMVVLIDRNFGFTVTAKDFAGIKTFQDFYNLVIFAHTKRRLMTETWKGKTRGGTFGYMLLHLHDSLSGYHCGLRLSVIGRPLFYTFRTESYRQYLGNTHGTD